MQGMNNNNRRENERTPIKELTESKDIFLQRIQECILSSREEKGKEGRERERCIKVLTGIHLSSSFCLPEKRGSCNDWKSNKNTSLSDTDRQWMKRTERKNQRQRKELMDTD